LRYQIKIHMNKVRLISRILYIICKVLLVGYGLTFLHALIALVFKTSSLNIIEDGKRFEIYFPFGKVSFLIGYFEKGYIIFGFLMVLGLYAIFFYLLGNFFKAFASEKLFTIQNLKYVNWFSYSNLILPILALILASLVMPIEDEISALAMMHILLGVFAYFLAALFQQGLKIQNDQDLFI
jgi:hypothetical protein